MHASGILQQRKSDILALAHRYGLRRVRVFGSTARGDVHPGSDIDLLVEPGPGVSIIDLGGFQSELQDLLGCHVDVVTENGLRPRIRQRVLDEAVGL